MRARALPSTVTFTVAVAVAIAVAQCSRNVVRFHLGSLEPRKPVTELGKALVFATLASHCPASADVVIDQEVTNRLGLVGDASRLRSAVCSLGQNELHCRRAAQRRACVVEEYQHDGPCAAILRGVRRFLAHYRGSRAACRAEAAVHELETEARHREKQLATDISCGIVLFSIASIGV